MKSAAPLNGDYECISLNGLVLQLHIGLRDWERAPDRRQRVQVDVECYRPLTDRPRSIDDCMDYSRLYQYLTKDWPSRPHTDLLETLAHDLVEFVLQDPRVKGVRVRLAKPDVYLDMATPAFEITRFR
jgi:7,8-dihydroneopterin aldolase/epimerase/oxygenase